MTNVGIDASYAGQVSIGYAFPRTIEQSMADHQNTSSELPAYSRHWVFRHVGRRHGLYNKHVL
jgi:hypothetical protein